jgi:cytosine deaminase
VTESVPPQPQQPGRPDDLGGEPGPAPALLLTDARLGDGRLVDVRLSGGRIEAVGTAGSLGGGRSEGDPTPPGARVDLAGYLLLPAPAEPHAHLDTALTADPAGPPSDAEGDLQRRVTEAALLQLGHGATALRTHVRVGDVQGLAALEAVLRARRSLRGLVELTTVAMPRVLTGAAGGDGLAMLREAMKMGADVVGGCPDLDPDPTGYAEAALGVANEFGCPVDLHIDGGDPARLARLAAMAGGLRPGVTLSGCAGLAGLRAETLRRAAGQLAAAGASVVCLPQGGCGAPGRGAGPGHGHAPGVFRALRGAGVRVTAGSGALRDAANPVGRGDPLEAAFLLASHGECGARTAYDTIAGQARAVLGLPEVRVEAGFPAELLAVRGQRVDGVLSLAYSRIVVHRGRVVSRTSAVREYADCEATAALDLPRQSRPGAAPQ